MGQERSETIKHFIFTRQAGSTLDENPDTRTAILRVSDNRLTDKHISPKQEVLQWPNKSEGKLKRNRETECHL